VLCGGLVRGRGRGRRPGAATDIRGRTASGAAAVPAAVAGSPQRAWRSQSSLKKRRHSGDRNATGEMTGSASWAPSTKRHRCTSCRALRGPRITCPTEHVNSRTGHVSRQGAEGRVPGIRRSPSGGRSTNSLSAVPGSRTRDTENPREALGGGRSRPRTTNAPNHRREASRNGATSAEREGRPVLRRNSLADAASHRSQSAPAIPRQAAILMPRDLQSRNKVSRRRSSRPAFYPLLLSTLTGVPLNAAVPKHSSTR
jgi:hypothetical protein